MVVDIRKICQTPEECFALQPGFIVFSELELHFYYYIHFLTNTLRRGMTSLSPTAMG